MSRKRPPRRHHQNDKQELSDAQQAVTQGHSGLVITRFGAKVEVEDEAGNICRCTSRRKFGAVVCGDQVIWQPTHDNEGIIAEVLPRRTLLARPDDSGRDKPIAANITQLIIVATVKALADENYYLNHNLIDRYLVAAENLDITPVILVNKRDLLSEKEFVQLQDDMQPYQSIGYQVIYTSTRAAHGLEHLMLQLQHQTSVFVGESGVGKSSIIRCLLQDQAIRVGEVSAGTGKGKHTTTGTTLYHLKSGGDLIDSPGVREFGLNSIEPDALDYSFIEFRPFINQCRFHDCIHRAEPDCAVKQAVTEGRISRQRYDNYLEILASLKQK
jgi:ribosome biogenesis GTPase